MTWICLGRTMSKNRPGTDRQPSLNSHSPSDSATTGLISTWGPSPGLEVVDEEPLLHADLGRGETDTRGVVHRLEHVLGQLHEPTVDLGDLVGALAQHRIADDADGVGGGHGRKGTVTGGVRPGAATTTSPTSPAVALATRARCASTSPTCSLTLAPTGACSPPSRVDPGTKLLLMELPPARDWPEGAVVDVGCGYGPIAVAAGPSLTRTRGVGGRRERAGPRATAANAAAAGVAVSVSPPDEVPDDLRVGLMVSNPPIRIGKAALHDLLEHVARPPDGRRRGVAGGAEAPRRRLPGRLAPGRGHDVERVRSRQGYRILRVRR